jgi:pyridoxine 4-dehydrogenase
MTHSQFLLGGDLPVNRLGFGAMRITGAGVWGPPRDRNEALAVLRRAIELGVNFIDTAESYGPKVSEELISEALHPYREGLVIATKGGFDRSGPNKWEMNARPQRLREELEGSLQRLRVDRIDLYQLHRIDPAVPQEEQFGALVEFQREGKIRHIGLSEVTVEQIERARKHFPVASVQNRYNLGGASRSASSRGIHWPSANWRGRAVRSRPSPRSTRRSRRRLRWPGCSSARRPCFRSRERQRSNTSKRT